MNWELDVWGRIRRNVESNRESAQASAGDLAGALLSSRRRSPRLFPVARDGSGSGTAGTLDGRLRRALEVTHNRYQAGVAQRSDVTQAQTQLENARAQWLDLGNHPCDPRARHRGALGQAPGGPEIARKDETPTIRRSR